MFIETEVSFYGAPMFYFKEVYTRLLYCVLSTSLLFFVCYNSSELICSLYFIGLLRFIRALGENVTSPHFVYTSPLELWNLLYNLFIFLALTLSFPFYVWNALMFYKSSLFSWEYRRVRRAIVLLVVLIILLNLLCFFIILPGTCSVLAEFNNELVFSSVLDIFLELKVTDFFGYLCDFFLFFNFFCFLIGLLIFFCYYLSISQVIKLKPLVQLSYLLLPWVFPFLDFFFQVLLFLILCFFLEVLIFFKLIFF